MQRTNLYEQIGLKDHLWGDYFEYESERPLLIDERNVLDSICLREKLNPVGDRWNSIQFDQFTKLLYNGLRYDLAHTSGERMSKERAEFFFNKIIHLVDKNECRFRTNWAQSPWSEHSGNSWNSLTDHTFDLAIVILEQMKVSIIYFISED